MSNDPRLERLAETLRTGLTKRDPMPLRRHKDDSYWDEVVVLAGPVVLHGTMVPQYKTSGLSGDELYTSASFGYVEGRTKYVEGRTKQEIAEGALE